MKQTEAKLVFVDYCYAELSDNIIKIHKDLAMYDVELYQHALEHEKGHVGNTYWQDLVWDFKDMKNWKIHLKSIKFMAKYPKVVFKNLSPVWYFKGEGVELATGQLTNYFVLSGVLVLLFYFLR